jgi:hypothetical protein
MLRAIPVFYRTLPKRRSYLIKMAGYIGSIQKAKNDGDWPLVIQRD